MPRSAVSSKQAVIDWLLRALAVLEHNSPGCLPGFAGGWDLAGKGPLLDPLKYLAATLGIADRVQFSASCPTIASILYDQAHQPTCPPFL